MRTKSPPTSANACWLARHLKIKALFSFAMIFTFGQAFAAEKIEKCSVLMVGSPALTSKKFDISSAPVRLSALLSFPDLRLKFIDDITDRKVERTYYTNSIKGDIALAQLAKNGASKNWVLSFYGREYDSSRQIVTPSTYLAAIETLYSDLLRLDQTALFTTNVRTPNFEPHKPLNAKETYTALKEYRDCVSTTLDDQSKSRIVPWTTAEITVNEKRSKDNVSVTVVDEQRTPVSGANITAEKGGHAICWAETNSKGVAMCRLRDSHGDETHAPPKKSKTIVFFSGVVANGRVILPTTISY